MPLLTIGDAARVAGISARAIRLWDTKGLLPGIGRTPSGYRTFDESALEVLHFIHRAQQLGMTLDQIKRILDMQQAGTPPCGQVTQMLDERIKGIDQTLEELTLLRQSLLVARNSLPELDQSNITVGMCHIIKNGATSV